MNVATLSDGQRTGLHDDRRLPLDDTPELRNALAVADIHTLLMVYVHLSHDTAFLDRFAQFVAPISTVPAPEIPAEMLDELRSNLLFVLTSAEAETKGEPSDELMHRMMSAGVGEEVAEEFLPLLHEQMGFTVPTPRSLIPDRKHPATDFKVLVIGAGMSGLAAAKKLEEAGYSFVVIEKNGDVGGTWYENCYPGVGVDTASHFYSFSWEISPDWNDYYPKGSDMQDYLLHCADKHDLRRNIRFRTRVTELHYDYASNIWNVTVEGDDGAREIISANAVINAHGPVNRFKMPEIEGLDAFPGIVRHTANWDPSIDVTGKRVALIGTGASGAQVIPAIADKVESLAIFMRTGHWVKYNPGIMGKVSDGMKFALRHIPHFREWYRFRIYWVASDGLFPNVVKDPAWEGNDIAVSAHNDASRKATLDYMAGKFGDRPDLMEKLVPDFPIYSKRIVMDTGMYDALLRNNVTLETNPIARVTDGGVEMEDGTLYPIDIIICATGFDVANMMGNLEITGLGGRRLRDQWGTEDARAYKGLTVPGYPNYFHMVGPNSAPNHAAGQNLISEAQVNYIIECLDWLQAEGRAALHPSEVAYEAWNETVDARMQQMIWSHPRANSYYNNSRHRNYLSWPWRLIDFWNVMRGPDKDDFVLI